MRFTYWWVRNCLILILCNCFTGAVLWLVSRELLRSHSFSQGLVLQPVGRASVVVRTGQTTATVALPARALQVPRVSNEIGNHYIMFKDQWKQRYWHRGVWRPQKHKDQMGLMKKVVVPLWEEKGGMKRKPFWNYSTWRRRLLHFLRVRDHKSMVKLYKE